MNSAACSSGGQPNGFRASDGKLWFATEDGIAVLDPQAARVNLRAPPVRVEELTVDGRSIAGNGSVRLTPGQVSLDIQYTALSFVKSNQIHFRYRMEGLDSDWIEAGTRRTAYYTRIPPGSYTFRVIAANSDGVWNNEGAKMAVRVLPPYYRTWWFQLSVSLVVAALIAGAWRYRVLQWEREQALQQAFSSRLIASQEEERKRIAAELHDSLGQRLVIVKNLALFFLRAQGEEPVKSGKLRSIEEISAEAALAIDETREISYNLRPFQLDRLGLTKAIEGIVGTASTACSIRFSQELDNIDEVFPEDLRINFYRIVQESVNNVMKHAEATEVSIRVERTTDHVLLTIRDDGKGFTPGTARSDSDRGGFGVTGMAERARSLGGRMTVQATPGHGTTVLVRVPIAEIKR
jgi:signal transduction histidine kinase